VPLVHRLAERQRGGIDGAILSGVVEVRDDLVVKQGLVALEGEKIVGSTVDDLPGDLLLAAFGVDRAPTSATHPT
jgi:hypothetical protein